MKRSDERTYTAKLEIRIWSDKQLPDDLPEALEHHVEHVQRLCSEGFTCGNIVDDNFAGWWDLTQDERTGPVCQLSRDHTEWSRKQ